MNVNRPPSSYVNPTLAQKGCFYKHSYQSVSMKLHILYHCICLARFYLCIYAYLSVYMSICVYMCTYVCIQHMCIKNYKHTYCKYGDISACNPSTFWHCFASEQAARKAVVAGGASTSWGWEGLLVSSPSVFLRNKKTLSFEHHQAACAVTTVTTWTPFQLYIPDTTRLKQCAKQCARLGFFDIVALLFGQWVSRGMQGLWGRR